MKSALTQLMVILDSRGQTITSQCVDNAERAALSFVELVTNSLSFGEYKLANLMHRGLSLTIVTLFKQSIVLSNIVSRRLKDVLPKSNEMLHIFSWMLPLISD
jgi:hypothetical protein